MVSRVDGTIIYAIILRMSESDDKSLHKKKQKKKRFQAKSDDSLVIYTKNLLISYN